MTNVYTWPPVGLTGWEITTLRPVSRSVGLLDGRPRTSSALRERRLATAVVQGIGPDEAGAGYVEVLKRLLQGGQHLVKVECRPAIWHLRWGNGELISRLLEWTSGGVELLWTSGGDDLLWSDNLPAHGVPGTDGGWPSITVSGLPPSQIVARPGELIRVQADLDAQPEFARVLTVARSNGSGVAVIRLMTAIAAGGLVSIGETEAIVFEALDMPRAVQPVGANWAYTWNFREVFQDEYPTTWVELNPWG